MIEVSPIFFKVLFQKPTYLSARPLVAGCPGAVLVCSMLLLLSNCLNSSLQNPLSETMCSGKPNILNILLKSISIYLMNLNHHLFSRNLAYLTKLLHFLCQFPYLKISHQILLLFWNYFWTHRLKEVGPIDWPSFVRSSVRSFVRSSGVFLKNRS